MLRFDAVFIAVFVVDLFVAVADVIIDVPTVDVISVVVIVITMGVLLTWTPLLLAQGPIGGPPNGPPVAISLDDVQTHIGEPFEVSMRLDTLGNPVDEVFFSLQLDVSRIAVIDWYPGAALQTYMDELGDPEVCDIFIYPEGHNPVPTVPFRCTTPPPVPRRCTSSCTTGSTGITWSGSPPIVDRPWSTFPSTKGGRSAARW